MSDRMPPGTSTGPGPELPRRQPGAFQGAHSAQAPDDGFDAFAPSDEATQIMPPVARQAVDAAQRPIPHQATPADAGVSAPNAQDQQTVVVPQTAPPAPNPQHPQAQNVVPQNPNPGQGTAPDGAPRGENGEPLPSEFDHLFRGSAAGQSTTVLPAATGPGAAGGMPQPGYPQQQPGPQQPGYPPQQQGYPQQQQQYGPPPGWNQQQGSPVPGFGPGPQQAAYQQGGYPQPDMGGGYQGGGYQQDWQQPQEGSRRRVIVIAGVCVVVAALVGLAFALTSSGGKPSTPSAGSSPSSQPAASSGATEKQQLDAVYSLIQQSEQLRSVVNSAVGSIEQCQNQAQDANKLRASAAKRRSLAAQVARLPVNKVPQGTQLVSLLRDGWSQSADSDTAFAAWGDDLATKCKPGKLPHNADYQRGVNASGVASNTKQRAAALWDEIAGTTGESQISATQF